MASSARELRFAAMIQEMLDAVDSCTDVPQQLIDAFQKIADRGKGALERHDAALTRLARAQGIREAAKIMCFWCKDGHIPTMESDFCQPRKLWHKIHQNWLMCQASDIFALLDRDAQEALAEHDRQVRLEEAELWAGDAMSDSVWGLARVADLRAAGHKEQESKCPSCGHKAHAGVSCLESDACGCGQ